MDELKNELFTYVKENTFKETDSLQSDTMLFVEGLLDSMGFALLLDFLETKFQIAAEDSDLVEVIPAQISYKVVRWFACGFSSG